MGWGWVALVARVTKCRPVVTGTTETKCNKPLSLVALRPRGGGGVWNTKLSCMERCARKKKFISPDQIRSPGQQMDSQFPRTPVSSREKFCLLHATFNGSCCSAEGMNKESILTRGC